ncbi:MAG: diguanylate cyclase [Candidatus Hydrogenedentota bacterium]
MSERILILDDEQSVLDVLSQLLTSEGYVCHTTVSPSDALDLVENERFALLITDVRMPEMDGIKVVHQAKVIDKNLAIIVATAILDVTNAVEAIRAGADDYVLKPFNLGEITLAVSRALDKRKRVLDALEYQQDLEERIRGATEDLEVVNHELHETKQYLENLLHSTVDAIFTLDREDQMEFVNHGAMELLGLSQEEFIGKAAAEVLRGGEQELRNLRLQVTPERPLRNYETELRRKNGQLVPVSVSVSVVKGARSRGEALLAICRDITEQRRLEQKLRDLSIKDSLTGVYNQRYFYERLKTEIERARRQKHPLSLLFFDIDRFKGYNDTYGHLEGDRVLRAVGSLVLDCTREHVDAGFRYGGDEFTVILPEASEKQALRIAERIRTKFEAQQFNGLTLSIGLMAYQEGYSLPLFIQFTDAMMYGAKRAGGNVVYVYEPESGLQKTGQDKQ